jgi:hypothetical protein
MFFPFIIYAITLLFFKNIEDNYKNKFISEKVFAIGIIISVVCWVAILYFPQSVLPVLRGFARSEFIPRPLTQSTAFISTLAKAVSGPNESISSFPGGSSALCIRYDAKRPLLYCFKDGGTLLYGDLAKARGWYRNSKEVRNLRRVLSSDYSPSEKGASLVRWSESLNAQFLIVSGYKNTVLDFGSARTIQCHGDTIVDLRNRDLHSSNRQPDDLHLWGFEPKGKVIDLFAPSSFPVWLKRLPNSKDVSNIKKGFNDKHIIIEAVGKKKELGYKIQISPGKIYLFTCWLYYERNSADFDISIGSWEAKLYGGRLFKDKNPVLSESGKWKKHEILILVPPEIHPNSVNIDFYVLSIKGEGKVIVKSPTFQYMEKFPLKDGLEINADFGAFKESNKLHYRRNS